MALGVGAGRSVRYIDQTEEETSAQEAEAPETAEASSYVSPVDFEELQKVNKDIYAWLEIPGTNVSYPILQHPTEDEYYLRRNYKGRMTRKAVFLPNALTMMGRWETE